MVHIVEKELVILEIFKEINKKRVVVDFHSRVLAFRGAGGEPPLFLLRAPFRSNQLSFKCFTITPSGNNLLYNSTALRIYDFICSNSSADIFSRQIVAPRPSSLATRSL